MNDSGEESDEGDEMMTKPAATKKTQAIGKKVYCRAIICDF
jgi:hypothetical protein